MKNNIFGYLFFIFIIIIMGFAIYKVSSAKKTEAINNNEGTTSVVSTEKGTELTLAVSGFDTINPIITKNKQVQDITKLVFESLVNITSDGKAEPCLAKEWETTDNMTYIVKLKGGIKWSDGTYFSSNDVKYTIDRMLQDKQAKNAVYAENVRYLKEVDIIDNTTLRIILSQKIPFYEYFLTFPILSSSYYGVENFWDTNKNDTPVSTGRFFISENIGNRIILTKNPNWWNIQEDNSIIDKITINFYSSVAELYNAFRQGSIDIISTKNNDYKQYIGKIGYKVTETEGRDFSFIALNNNSEILSDVNVRKAIRYAINKDEVVAKAYGNSYFKANFPLLTTNYLVEDKNENYFDIGKMENSLKDSGWYFRKKQWQKTVNYKTKALELNLVVRKKSNRVNVANYMKDELAEQGIIINIIQASDNEYSEYINNKKYDLILSEITNPISPDLTSYFGNGNLANFDNDEAKKALNELNSITDKEELKKRYKKLYDIYNNEVPYIGIGRNKIYVITSSYLNGEIESRWYNLYFKFKDWYKN